RRRTAPSAAAGPPPLKRPSPRQDVALANLAFRAIGEGGQPPRWETVFFDWFFGPASAGRALEGPRAALCDGPEFKAFRDALQGCEPERPERLEDAWFARPEPEEMLYDQVEALWAPIAEHDDWRPFEAKVAAVREAGLAM